MKTTIEEQKWLSVWNAFLAFGSVMFFVFLVQFVYVLAFEDTFHISSLVLTVGMIGSVCAHIARCGKTKRLTGKPTMKKFQSEVKSWFTEWRWEKSGEFWVACVLIAVCFFLFLGSLLFHFYVGSGWLVFFTMFIGWIQRMIMYQVNKMERKSEG